MIAALLIYFAGLVIVAVVGVIAYRSEQTASGRDAVAIFFLLLATLWPIALVVLVIVATCYAVCLASLAWKWARS